MEKIGSLELRLTYSRAQFRPKARSRAIFFAAFIVLGLEGWAGAAFGAGMEKVLDFNSEMPFETRLIRNETSRCPGPSGHTEKAYRALIKIGGEGPEEDRGRWLLQTKSHLIDNDRKSIEPPLHLRLSDKNTYPGATIMTPTFNADGQHYCVSVQTGHDWKWPPDITIERRLFETTDYKPLSVYGPNSGALANWVPATDLKKDCDADGCPGAFEDKDLPQQMQALWPVTPALDDRTKRERLAAALTATVWLGIERHDSATNRDGDQGPYELCEGDGDCYSHCTGFFVAPRVVMTNAHCLIGSESADGKVRHRYAVRGWIRPLEGDANGRHQAPQLQHLTPIFVGSPKSKVDYALLWVEDENLTENGLTESTLPKPLPVSAETLREKDNLTIFSYPKDNGLEGSFDSYCKVVSIKDDILNHQCDTMGGSSGAPVFDRALAGVRAIHFGGFREDDGKLIGCNESTWADCANAAAPIYAVRDDIAGKVRVAGLDRFLAEDCGAAAPDQVRRKALSTLDFPVLSGGRGASPAMILAAYRSLPEALRAVPDDCPSPFSGD